MDFKPIATALGKFAPTVASALGGPAAGAAVSAIEKIFGFEPGQSNPDQLAGAIAGATPDQQLALQKMELDYHLATQQASYSDTANARAREIAVRDTTPRNLAYAILGYVAAVHLYILCTHMADNPVSARILTTVDGALLLMLGYYFGSMNKADK